MITAIFENNQLVSYSLKTWQYDYGQVLRIQGLNLPTAVEIHFSLTEKGGESVTRVGMTKDGVTDVVIPDSFLENNDITQDYRIYAFIYLRDDASGQTEYKIPISVTSRPKPEAFDRPEDGEIFKEAIQAVRQSADQAAESVRQAEAIKESVQDMVDTIGSVDEKVQAVKEFSQKAETASSNAALSESRAKESKTAAETAKTAAVQSAESARQSATAVEQAVSGFDEKVAQSSTAIESAKTKAVKAVEDKGDEVLQSIPPDFETQMANKVDKQQGIESKGKTLVVGDDGNVVPGEVQSGGDGIAIVNTASGESPLVIPDSAERVNKGFGLTGKTEQVQTSGKNLANPSELVIGNLAEDTGNIVNLKQYITTGYIPVIPGKMYSTSCGNKFSAHAIIAYDKEKTKINSPLNMSSEMPEGAAYIRLAYKKIDMTNVTESDMEELKKVCMVNEGSTVLSYEQYTGGKPSPSPEYPQEIRSVGKLNEETGKYEVQVKLTGKNLFDTEKAKIFENWTPSTQNGKSGYLDFPIYVGKGNKFTISIKAPAEKVPELYLCLALKKYGGNAGWLYHATSTYNTCLIKVAEEDYVFLRCIKEKVSDLTNIVQEIQVEISPNQTTYQPYKEQTLTLTSDRPITKWDKLVEQGGQIGWLYGGKIVTLTGDEEWISNLNAFYTRNYDIKNGNNPLCSHYVNKSIVNQEMDNIFSVGDGVYENSLWIRDTRFSTVKDFSAHLLEMAQKGEPITVIASSKTEAPEFVPLPQSEQDAIRALLTYYPTTAITADGGEVNPNIEVTYTADTKNYIDKKIEAINKAIVTTQKALL